MKKQTIAQRKRLAAIFASFAILLMGTVSLLESMTIDYYTVINTLGKVIPAAIALGGIGWIMGVIIDKPKTRRPIAYNNLFVNNMLKPDMEEKTPTFEVDTDPVE